MKSIKAKHIKSALLNFLLSLVGHMKISKKTSNDTSGPLQPSEFSQGQRKELDQNDTPPYSKGPFYPFEEHTINLDYEVLKATWSPYYYVRKLDDSADMARWDPDMKEWGLKSAYQHEVKISRPETSKTPYVVLPVSDLELLTVTGTTKEGIQKILWRIDNNQVKQRYYKVEEL